MENLSCHHRLVHSSKLELSVTDIETQLQYSLNVMIKMTLFPKEYSMFMFLSSEISLDFLNGSSEELEAVGN